MAPHVWMVVMQKIMQDAKPIRVAKSDRMFDQLTRERGAVDLIDVSSRGYKFMPMVSCCLCQC
jgi:hypothetical protein